MGRREKNNGGLWGKYGDASFKADIGCPSRGARDSIWGMIVCGVFMLLTFGLVRKK